MKTGQIIWEQLKTMDTNLMMCMGVNQLCLTENGLRFKVKGLKFKGFVYIELNHGQDLYEVKLVKMKRKLNALAKSAGIKMYDQIPTEVFSTEGIFFDQLPSLLEREVEGR